MAGFDLNRIIQGDTIQVLDSPEWAGQFDVIIADPPYNIGKDFGNDSDCQDPDKYLQWVDQWIHLCLKTLTDNGVMYIYGQSEILARIAARQPLQSQRWLVWHYTNKAHPASQFWQRSHESILCLWNGTRPPLQIDQIREPYGKEHLKSVGKVRASTQSRFGFGKETFFKAHDNGAQPRDVIKTPALAGGAGASERWFLCHDCGGAVFHPKEIKHHRTHSVFKHPTQKPFTLTNRLLLSAIDIQTDKTGRALIPFAGSGSECVVARKLGIDYLGIELNPAYVDFARKWISVSD